MTAMAVACCFNPRAREERDVRPTMRSRSSRRFNPRAREERDLGIYARLNRITGFNPRAREERDVLG